MQPLTVGIEPLAYVQVDEPWLDGLRPYGYQSQVYHLVAEALTRKETLCLFLVTPTGSGKTLASHAYCIKHAEPAFGVYPTNELIRDQETALRPRLAPDNEYGLLRIDSAQLDYWQDALQVRQHALAFERLMNWQPTILTNPDILFYAFFGLYVGPRGLSQRLFSLLGQYRLFIFDEFHLYNVKQMADVAFLIATLRAVSPGRGRVFVLASATPESPALKWLRDRLSIPVELVEAQPSDAPEACIISHPLHLTVLPADLRHWKGVDGLLEYLPRLQEFVSSYPQARMVTILDSVAGAISTARALRTLFPAKPVGEVHGFSSELQRAEALQQPFTVGTSTLEVGIDFKDAMEKDVLLFEARTASQFVQRLGRLARHDKRLPIPNHAVAVVPEYVYHFLASRLAPGRTLSKHSLYRLVDEAYQRPETFERYLVLHAPAEFQEARRCVQGLFQADDRPRIAAELEAAIHTLTGKTGPQAWAMRHRCVEEGILKPLLTFRGNGFEAAVLDHRGTDPGFPARRYNLMFMLRRGVIAEMEEDAYLQQLDTLTERCPAEAARQLRYSSLIAPGPQDLLGVYGYFALTGLLDEGRKVWFEVAENEVYGRQGHVTVVTGLEVVTEPAVRLRRLNRLLRRKRLVAWFVDRHPAAIKFGRGLPALFELYELRVRRVGGRLSDSPWSIAFNQDAFFVDSLGWWTEQKEDRAIVL